MTGTASDTPNYDIVKELLEEVPNNKYTESKLSRIRSLYCKGSDKSKHEIRCTDDEFYKFMYHLIRFGLDPFQGYIQCIKYSEGIPAQIFLGKDAYLAVVSKQPSFDGIEAGIFYRSNSDVAHRKMPTSASLAEQESATVEVKHPNDAPKMYGFAKVYRNDRSRPTYIECPLKEYHRGNEVWNTRPETMIKKVAISQACRDAYPEIFAGLYTTEEFGFVENDVFRPPVEKATPIKFDESPVKQPVSAKQAPIEPTIRHVDPFTVSTSKKVPTTVTTIPPEPIVGGTTEPAPSPISKIDPKIPTSTVVSHPIDPAAKPVHDVLFDKLEQETKQNTETNPKSKKLGF